MSKSVTAPTAGLLVIMSSVEAGKDNTPIAPAGVEAGVNTRITVDGVQVGGVGSGVIDDDSGIGCGDNTTLAISGAVAVTAGDHTVTAQISRSRGTLPVFVGYGSVTTLFVPFGNAGTGVVGRPGSN